MAPIFYLRITDQIPHAMWPTSCYCPIDLCRNRPVSEFICWHCVFPNQKGYIVRIRITSALQKNILSIMEALPRGYAFNEGWREKQRYGHPVPRQTEHGVYVHWIQ